MEAKVLIGDVIKITGIGVVLVGTVTSGVLMNGMSLTLQGKSMKVMSIESDHQRIEEATERTPVGIALRNADFNLLDKMRGKELTFTTGEHKVQTPGTQPTHSGKPRPEGFFGRLFRR